MDEIRKLFEQARALRKQSSEAYVKAAELVAAGDVDGAKAKEVEGDSLEQKAVSIEQLAEKQKAQAERQKALQMPEIPAPLPVDSPSNGTIVQPGQPNSAEAAKKAVYQLRYGGVDAAVKAVIVDLYGDSYEEDRARQSKAFFAYMRGRDHTLDNRDWTLLRTSIPTPAFIRKAIDAGWDTAQIKSTMVEAVDTLGGFVVPVDFQERIIERMPGLTVMRGRAQSSTTMRDRVQRPKTSGGNDQYVGNVRMVWVDETPSSTTAETNATFSLEDIPIHTLMGVIPLSKNILEDSAFDLGAYLTRQFAQARAIAEDNSFLAGNGVGKPQGILVGSSGAPVTGVTTVNSGAAAAMTFDGVIAMTFGIGTQYKQGTRPGPNGPETRAVWIGARATFQALAQLKDADGTYLWTEMRGNNAVGQPNTLRGYNVLEQETMPAVAANTYPLLFGDPEAYEIVDRVGMTVQRYDVNPGENIIKYEARFRVGGQCVEPWRICAQKVAA